MIGIISQHGQWNKSGMANLLRKGNKHGREDE